MKSSGSRALPVFRSHTALTDTEFYLSCSLDLLFCKTDSSVFVQPNADLEKRLLSFFMHDSLPSWKLWYSSQPSLRVRNPTLFNLSWHDMLRRPLIIPVALPAHLLLSCSAHGLVYLQATVLFLYASIVFFSTETTWPIQVHLLLCIIPEIPSAQQLCN